MTPPPPDITVVVVLLDGPDALRGCLRALDRQLGGHAMEVLIPWDAAAGERAPFEKEFPSVHVLPLDGVRTPAERRAHGVARARGRIVALTEDHCTPSADWCDTIVRAHNEGRHTVVGGVVEKGTPADTVSWALFLADYLRYMPPMGEGSVHELTDCNVAYDRMSLEDVSPVWSEEFHEPLVHRALRGRGHRLWLSPSMVVHESRRIGFARAMRERYAFGRLFGATRIADSSLTRRTVLVGAAVVLPALLLGRVFVQAVRKGRHLGASLAAFPTLTALSAAWSWGELTGYITARPGRSLSPGGRT